MDKDSIINAIVRFCFDYSEVIDEEIKAKVEEKLNSPCFIENVIATIHKKAKNGKNIDRTQVKILLLALEKNQVRFRMP